MAKKQSKITRFDRPMLEGFAQEVIIALTDFCESHGLVAQAGGGTFSDTAYDFKVKFAIKDENGEAKTYEREMFLKYAELRGLKPEWLGATFTYAASLTPSSDSRWAVGALCSVPVVIVSQRM